MTSLPYNGITDRPPVKINKKTLEMEEDDRFDSITLEELQDGESPRLDYS